MKKSITADRIAWAAVAAIAICAFLIRVFHAGDPIGGFHSFNEGWYAALARGYSRHSILLPIVPFMGFDYNVVPFYSHILFAAMSLFGDKEITLRMTAIAFSAATLPFLYLIGRRLYNRAAGICAAALYAFCPFSVTVGRNIQTDAVYLFFMLAALHIYLKSSYEERPRLLAGSGILYGLALFTKQFAILVAPSVAAWELLRGKGPGKFNRWHIVFAALSLSFVGPFVLYHTITRAGQIVSAQTNHSANLMRLPENLMQLKYIFSETFWGFSPLATTICAAAIIYALVKRSRADFLVLFNIGVYIVFILMYNGHSYYQMCGVPFLCLISGRLIGSIRPRAAAATLIGIAALLAAAQSIAFLCSVKYGYSEFADIARATSCDKDTLLILDSEVAGSYLPAMNYYCPDSKITREPDLTIDKKTGKYRQSVEMPPGENTFLVTFLSRPELLLPPHRIIMFRSEYVFAVLGRQIIIYTEGEHYFTIRKVTLGRLSSWKQTGVFKALSMESLYLGKPAPGAEYPVINGLILFGKGTGGQPAGEKLK